MTCSGACCVVFPLSGTYAELIADPESKVDGSQLVDMLIPLTVKEAQERAIALGGTVAPHWAESAELFTCRHWDEETRLCRIYNERPDMCRRYPYGRGCDQGCDCAGTP